MKVLAKYLRPTAFAAAALVLAAGTAVAQEAMFGSEDDMAYAQALWAAMQDSGLAGADSVVQPRAYEGVEPHGAILQTFRTIIEVDGTEGELVVKRNYMAEGLTPGDVWNNPGEGLAAVTVMFKRDGFDPDNGDWFWAKYLPDGSLDVAPNDAQMAGKVQGCIGCHSGAGDGDMLFVND